MRPTEQRAAHGDRIGQRAEQEPAQQQRHRPALQPACQPQPKDEQGERSQPHAGAQDDLLDGGGKREAQPAADAPPGPRRDEQQARGGEQVEQRVPDRPQVGRLKRALLGRQVE